MPEKALNEVINVLDSEIKGLKQRSSPRLIILRGSSDKKNSVLKHFEKNVRQSEMNVVHTTLEDISGKDRVEFDEGVIVIDGLDYFLFQPPLGRLSLQLKLSRFFDEVGHRPATLIVLGATSGEALKYFSSKFKNVYSKAEILEIM